MARSTAQQQWRWRMHVRFEPTRLQAAPLVEAYEAVLPVPRRRPVAAPERPRPAYEPPGAGRSG